MEIGGEVSSWAQLQKSYQVRDGAVGNANVYTTG